MPTDFCEIARNSSGLKRPAPGSSLSMTYFGMVITPFEDTAGEFWTRCCRQDN
jgi:hypothetical protein